MLGMVWILFLLLILCILLAILLLKTGSYQISVLILNPSPEMGLALLSEIHPFLLAHHPLHG